MVEAHTTPSGIVVEFRQHDWMPGFAAYLHEDGRPFPNGTAFCALNLHAFLGAHATTDETHADFVKSIADTMVHEVIHVIEAWAGVEFSEARVEKLIDRYRERASEHGDATADTGMDFSAALYLAKAEGRRIRRKGWDAYVHLHADGFLEMVGKRGTCTYHASSEEMLAEDWEVVDG